VIGYYLALAWRSLRRNIVLTLLMIVTIAFGVGASMTTLTVLHVLSADPIPEKSDRLYYVQLDPRPLSRGHADGEPNKQQTLLDAQNLLKAKKADRQAMMTGASAGVDAQRPDLPPFYIDVRRTTADFFPMFDVPFIAGTAWTADDDEHSARVIVIAKALAEKVFGSTDVIGKTLRVEGQDLRVIGVTADWRPVPQFYDLNRDIYGMGELGFVPFSTSTEIKISHSGETNCWDDQYTDEYALGAPCEWIQFWVELDSKDKAATYKDFLVAYSQEQKRAGRFQRDPNVRLREVMAWLESNQVVPSDARLQTWIALGFLLVCLINTIGLLLTKFLRRSADIGVRRALGASKRAIFAQLLVEAGVVGMVGGLLGLLLAWLGLWAVRQQPASYADLAHLDVSMLVATLALAILTSLLAGLLPAWRGCQVAPAAQLKSH
jgi:putative ABC transport system permease protein